MPDFGKAAEARCNWIELDVQLVKDGQVEICRGEEPGRAAAHFRIEA